MHDKNFRKTGLKASCQIHFLVIFFIGIDLNNNKLLLFIAIISNQIFFFLEIFKHLLMKGRFFLAC